MGDDGDEENNVHEFPTADSVPVLMRKEKREYKGYCRHEKVWIDTDDEILTCRTCGVPVNPYKHIRTVARQREQINRELSAEKAMQDATAYVVHHLHGRISISPSGTRALVPYETKSGKREELDISLGGYTAFELKQVKETVEARIKLLDAGGMIGKWGHELTYLIREERRRKKLDKRKEARLALSPERP